VLAKGILPIIGPRTPAQMADNLAAATVRLSEEHVRQLDTVSAIPMGFPHEVVAASSSTWSGVKPELLDPPARAVR
jgi:diketogulonate reductase-like aldo/keto reductase